MLSAMFIIRIQLLHQKVYIGKIRNILMDMRRDCMVMLGIPCENMLTPGKRFPFLPLDDRPDPT